MKNRFVPLSLLFLFLSVVSCQKDVDLTVDSLEQLEEKLRIEFSDKGLISVAYGVVKADRVLHSGALGFADEHTNRLATDQTRYLVASISKTITAVAAMQLVEQNLIGLDDDVNTYLPFPVRNPHFPSDKITLRMLLSHRSSISDQFQENFDLDCYGMDCTMTLAQYFHEVFLETGAYHSPDNFSDKRPGSSEDYSNLGSALIGYLVERITLTPFDEFCRNTIFAPLGMTKTEWRLANIPLAELAIPYSDEISNPNPHYTFPDYPNGGLRTTVADLSNFLRMVIQDGSFQGTEVLSSSTMAAMKTLQYGSSAFGLSFYYDEVNGRRVLGHSGGEKGATAEMFYDTSTNVGVIVFSNEEDADLENIMALLFHYGEKH